MQQYLKDNPEYQVISKERVVYPDTEDNAIAAVRTQLYYIENECKDHYGVDEFSNSDIILSGPGNYRENIATIFPYKGNRDPEHKPHWYQSIRDYLTGSWGARVISGREADDECSILARQDLVGGRDYVIATIDKDLDQIPGNHYNYLKQVFYAQSSDAAISFFYRQCLSGDPTDGVPGCWKIGDKRAADIISRLLQSSSSTYDGTAGANKPVFQQRRDDITKSMGERCAAATVAPRGDTQSIPVRAPNFERRNVWTGIIGEYRASQTRPGCPYLDRDPEAIALETARLVYLQQEEGELWTPPGEPKQYLPEYTDDT